MTLLQGIAHVGIVVRDMQATIDSLEHLGMKCVRREIVHRGGDIEVAFLQAGEQAVELLRPVDESESEFSKWLVERGEGVHHLALGVDNIEAMVTSLAGQGVPVSETRPNRTSRGSRSLWLTPDPLTGVRIQLVDNAESPENR